MKKIIYLILGILMVSLVSADKVDVYSFKVYSDGERQDVTWSDDEFEMFTGTIMEVQIRFENNWNETIELDIEGTLFEIGDDIERDKSIDIDEDEKKTIVFEYFIPADTKDDIYELRIRYDYNAQEGNQTVHYEKEKKFEIDIRDKTTEVEDIWVNISNALAYEKARTNDLLETVIETTNLSLRLDECRSDLIKETLNGEFKNKYESELNKSREFENKKTECETNKQNMYSQSQLENKVVDAETSARREQKKSDDNFTMMVAGAAIIYFIWKRKKETIGGKGEGVSAYGAKWK